MYLYAPIFVAGRGGTSNVSLWLPMALRTGSYLVLEDVDADAGNIVTHHGRGLAGNCVVPPAIPVTVAYVTNFTPLLFSNHLSTYM